MSDDILRPVLTIVGAVVGYWIGGPTGAQYGAMLGGLVGAVAFPGTLPTARGPKLEDLTVQSSAVGVAIPLVYGTIRIAGNIIWATDLKATTTSEEVGGKGGPTQKVETTTYSCTFAVGLCNNEITGVRRVWAGGKLIYDRRAQLPGETTEQYVIRLTAANAADTLSTLYLGTEDQLPDPTIEAHEGLGNVPAYRGLAYIVFRDFQLADYGNNLAGTMLSFEVVAGGAILFEELEQFAPPLVYPWLSNVTAPYDLRNIHVVSAVWPFYESSYGVFSQLVGDEATSPASAIAALESETGWANWPSMLLVSGNSDANDSVTTTTNLFVAQPTFNKHTTWQFYVPEAPEFDENYLSPASEDELSDPGDASGLFQDAVADGPRGEFGQVIYTEGGVGVSVWKRFPAGFFSDFDHDPVWHPIPPGDTQALGYNLADGVGGQWWRCFAVRVQGQRVTRAPDNPCFPLGLVPPPPSSQYPGFCVIGGTITEAADWVSVDTDYSQARMLQKYDDLADYREQVGPLVLVGDPNFDSQPFWEARYAEAETAGLMPSGMVYSTSDDNFPRSPSALPASPTQPVYFTLVSDSSFISNDAVTLAFIVGDLCERSGLSTDQFDVLQLTETVPGYALGRIMDAAAGIQPLRPYGFFDMVESGAALKFVVRGGLTVANIDPDDMAAHPAGDDRPSALETSRAQDVDLPRMLRVKYLMLEKDYEPGEQAASRLTTTADQVIDVEMPIALTNDRAAQLADVNLYEAWIGRNTYALSLAQDYIALEPTDPINIPVDGQLQRVRIVSEDFSIPGIKKIQAVRDGGLAAYSSYVGGGEPLISEQVLRVRDGTFAIYLDLPMLRDADSNAGYYVAMRQASETGIWAAATALRSADGGVNYFSVATAHAQSVTGVIVDALPAGETTVVDFTYPLTVVLDRDAFNLESVPVASLLIGMNAAAIGSDGRWEIIQFQNAELTGGSDGNGWVLTGLARGRRGTEHVMGTSMDGDQFVLLRAVVRAPQETASIGAERLLKAVTSGQAIDEVDAVLFTGNGEAFMPFAPVWVEGVRDGGDNLTITWVRRSRFSQELPSGADIPLGEASEAYEIEFLDGLTVVRTVSVSTPTYEYLAADQTSDYGSPPSAISMRIFQISAVIGRGHAAEATL